MSTATSNLVPVKVPSVGESITSGVIGGWKKKNGDSVASGDPLFEIETDKVTSEVFAETSGTLEILVAEGTEVKVGQVVAHILPGKGAGKTSCESGSPALSHERAVAGPKEESIQNQKSKIQHSPDSPIRDPQSPVTSGGPATSEERAVARTFRAGKESRRRLS